MINLTAIQMINSAYHTEIRAVHYDIMSLQATPASFLFVGYILHLF